MMTPTECKCYEFKEQGGQLSMGMRSLPEMKDHEVMIKVCACALSSTDEITKYGMLGDMKEMVPGCSVIGKVVKCGKDVKMMSMKEGGEIKEGMMVCGISGYGGLSEYCLCPATMVCEVPKSMMTGEKSHLECCVASYAATRIHCALLYWEKMHHSTSTEDKKMCESMCSMMGMSGEGCLVVYGSTGYAKLACDLLKSMIKHEMSTMKNMKVVLCTSGRWSANDYAMDKDRCLVVGQCDLASELRKMGGAKWCCATDMPEGDGLMGLLEGMRYNSQLVLLNPEEKGSMQLPVAQLIAKSISICGAPMPTGKRMSECLSLCEKSDLEIKTECCRFDDEEGVRRAWSMMEQRECFDAPVIEMCKMSEM